MNFSMQESKSAPDLHSDSREPIPSNSYFAQELACPILEDQILSGESSKNSQEGNQPRVKEYAVVTDEGTFATDVIIQTNYDEDEDENAPENIDFATVLMEDCKAELSFANLDTIVLLFRQVLDGYPTSHPFYQNAMRGLVSALGIRFIYKNDIHDLLESFTFRFKIIEDRNAAPDDTYMRTVVRPQDATSDTGCMVEMANGSLTDFQKSTSLHAINTIVFLLRRALSVLPASHLKRFAALNTLADGLYARFLHSRHITDLNEAIGCLQYAVKSCAERDPKRSDGLRRLGGMFGARFDFAGNEDDVTMANVCFFDITRQWSGTSSADIDMPLLEVAAAFYAFFVKSGKIDELNTSIGLFRDGIAELTDKSETYIDAVINLALMLSIRFQQGGRLSDIDESISLDRQVLELQPPSHPSRPASLNNLASALAMRFKQCQGSQPNDLDEAILLFREALELISACPDHCNRSTFLGNLGSALSHRYEQASLPLDIDEAISAHREALATHVPPHPDRSTSLNNLANTLAIRFEKGGRKSDIDEAISLHRQALELRPPSHADRSVSLNNLSSELLNRFKYVGNHQIDLDEAISLLREDLELRAPFHPDRSSSLSNLASALSTRFDQKDQLIDIDEAISLHRKALELRSGSPPHPDRCSSLTNLGNSLARRFQQGLQPLDINEAISFHRQALDLEPPPHPSRSSTLMNLSQSLLVRFNLTGTNHNQQSDLDEAIYMCREAFELIPLPHPHRLGALTTLSFALLTRFDKRGQRIYLDEAISLSIQAVELQPSPHPRHFASLYSLGLLFIRAHSLTGENSEYLEQAISSFRTATQSGPQSASNRLRAAKGWILHAEKYQHSSAIDAYEAALQLLPQVAALSFDIQSRQEALTADTDGLARDASRCAIRSGNLEKAIYLLEAGRTIFWSQVLSLRSPFDQLQVATPEFAKILQDIATELELGSHRDTSVEISDYSKKLFLDQEASRLNRLNEKWEKIIDEVRKLHGFEDFLRPLRVSSLISTASTYPVVILVPNDDSSHCLIIKSGSIHHIPLPILNTRMLHELVGLVRVAISQFPISRAFVERIREKIVSLHEEGRGMKILTKVRCDKLESSDDAFRYVLRILWDELVKPVVDFLNIQKSGEMPILQWCPAGLFSFLPIHAAGCYGADLGNECTFDYFISSYTPTIGALRAHPSPSPPPTQTFKMMVVIQSKELPSTKRELEKIQRHVSGDVLIELGVPGKAADVEAVASRLSSASIVHFACHGKQDRSKPLNSGLKLDDGLLRVSRIMKEPMPNGSLAFLCACETAMGDEKLPDEAISLGASLLFCGFRSVIATMWEMMDQDGPTVSDAFYEELFRGPDGKPALQPDTSRSAQALHVAVKNLRSQNVSFRRWVPFIHMGK